jgi:hypothetical protein
MFRAARTRILISMAKMNRLVAAYYFFTQKFDMFRTVFLLMALSLLYPTVVQAMDCAGDTRVIGSCYDVHGRLAVYASMRPRLQPDGAADLLAIVPASGLETGEMNYYWPHTIDKVLSMDADIVADFHVCPFTPADSGKMQFVCIEALSNMRTEPSYIASQKQPVK